jgi:hypothetical protein
MGMLLGTSLAHYQSICSKSRIGRNPASSRNLDCCAPSWALHVDRDGRLHNPAGPAWAWADGTEVWALDGIRVPSWVITDPDPDRIITDLTNTEQRRVAFRHYGWDKAVQTAGWKLIDEHSDPHVGRLYQLPPEVANAGLLIAMNASPHLDGTWQTYGLLCDPNAKTAIEAQASLAGVPVEKWLELQRAT